MKLVRFLCVCVCVYIDIYSTYLFMYSILFILLMIMKQCKFLIASWVENCSAVSLGNHWG